MLVDGPEAEQAVKRILDYCAADTPWTRRLWRLGSLLELRELAEAWGAHQSGALSNAAVRYLGDTLTNRVKRDIGLGSLTIRGRLAGYTSKPLMPGSHALFAVQVTSDEAMPGYLRRWADDLRTSPVQPEVISRAVTAHLLDLGFSETHLHKWFTYQRRHNPARMTLSDILEEAAVLASRPRIHYQALVPIVAAPKLSFEHDDHWLTARATSDWCKAWYPGHELPRQVGGLLLNLDARDIDSAAMAARSIVDRVSARFRVAARKRFAFDNQIYILGEASPIELRSRPRRVEVHALERTSAVYQESLPLYIDSALELMEPLDLGAPPAAITGSWAAIESLLVGPGDASNRVVAATRMARLVGCSYLRAEFTALANAHATTSNSSTAQHIRALLENKDKALYMESMFDRNSVPAFARNRHRAAALRLRQVVDQPSRTIPGIIGQLEDSFRRLYRQRNMIVHAGMTSSVALEGCLRTTASLIGAGIDRIVHASATRNIGPLELSALAEVRISEACIGQARLADLLP